MIKLICNIKLKLSLVIKVIIVVAIFACLDKLHAIQVFFKLKMICIIN